MTINGPDDNSIVGNDGDKDIVSMEVASDLVAVFIQPFTWAVISSTVIVGVVREPVHHDDHHLLSLV